MNVDDIKNIWKEDMQALESRLAVREDQVKQLEFNKVQTSFEKLSNTSQVGKNMTWLYALVSVFVMCNIFDAPIYAVIVGLGALAMVFSYFQHRPLTKLDVGRLSVLELQKELLKFKTHTAGTALFDKGILFFWVLTAGLGFYRLVFGGGAFSFTHSNPAVIGILAVLFVFWLITLVSVIIVASKNVYGNIDKELNQSLAMIADFEEGFEAEVGFKGNNAQNTVSAPLAINKIFWGIMTVAAVLYLFYAGFQFGVWLRG